MPIKGLTDKQAMFPKVGKLFKGSKKKKNAAGKEIQGDDLSVFRFETDIPSFKKAFNKLYENADCVTIKDSEGNIMPREIECVLFGVNEQDVFDGYMEEWDGSKLIRRCNGEKIIQFYDTAKGKQSFVPKDCLMECGQCKCKPGGKLKVYIPGLIKNAGAMGYVLVETHSINDVISLSQSVKAIQDMVGHLNGVPVILYRVEESVSTPDYKEKGKRVRRKKWLVKLRLHNQWVMDKVEQGLVGGEARFLFGFTEPPKALTAAGQPELPSATDTIEATATTVVEVQAVQAERFLDRNERMSLWTIAETNGFKPAAFKLVLKELGITSKEEIPVSMQVQLEAIFADRESAMKWNFEADVEEERDWNSGPVAPRQQPATFRGVSIE